MEAKKSIRNDPRPSDQAETYSFTTPFQQQKTIEAGEQKSRRLVDRAKNSLALVGELPQKPNNVPRALTIQPRCRFVQEQQEFGLGSELNTDRETFASFDVQREHKGVGERLELQKLNDFLDVRVFLLLRDVIWLSEVSGEPHSFADGSCTLVHVHLFSVGGSTSEVASERLSTDEEITRNNTDVLPLSEDVQASGLSGTGSTHESGHRAGFDITINIVKESTSSTGNRDSVIDAFPGESLVAFKGRSLFGLGSLLFVFDTLGSTLFLAEGSIKLGRL